MGSMAFSVSHFLQQLHTIGSQPRGPVGNQHSLNSLALEPFLDQLLGSNPSHFCRHLTRLKGGWTPFRLILERLPLALNCKLAGSPCSSYYRHDRLVNLDQVYDYMRGYSLCFNNSGGNLAIIEHALYIGRPGGVFPKGVPFSLRAGFVFVGFGGVVFSF